MRAFTERKAIRPPGRYRALYRCGCGWEDATLEPDGYVTLACGSQPREHEIEEWGEPLDAS